MNGSMSFKKWLGTPVILAVALGLLAVVPTLAKPPSAGKDKGNGMKHFGEITKDTEHIGGFFDVYHEKDKVYLEIPVDRLGEEILLIQSLSRGIGERILGGMPTEIFDGQIIKFERRNDRIHMIQVNHRFMAPEGTPAGAAPNSHSGTPSRPAFPS